MDARQLSRTRTGLITAGVLLVITVVAIGVGPGLIPPPPPVQETTTPPVSSDARLRPVEIGDWPVKLAVPATWTAVPVSCCEIRHFTGSSPEGHLSVGHESPYKTGVCDVECRRVDVPATIPYSAEAQLDALKASVAAVAGGSAWTPLGPDVLAVNGGSRLDTTVATTDGRPWHRVFIVGLRNRNVVAIAWTQPVAVFEESLLASVLGSIELTPLPYYDDGDLIDPPLRDTNFTMPIPGFWATSEHPELDGLPLPGVTRFGEGRVLVSAGDLDGTLGWCDPDCRLLTGQTTLDELERSVREGRDLGPGTSITLGGEAATIIGTE